MPSIPSIPAYVQDSVKHFKQLWSETNSELTQLHLPKIVSEKSNEDDLDQFFEKLINTFKNQKQPVEIEEQKLRKGFETHFSCDSSVILSKEYKKATRDFFKTAKSSDPDLTISDLYQAVRNFWIANSIQYISGKEIEFTPSLFAYSMLYPYTDNYLDNDNISSQHKSLFNSRLKDKLSGKEIKPLDLSETKIHAMVDIIEKQFPRVDFPQVFDSLLAIHAGQGKSILLNSDQTNDNSVILEITFEKGGTSVLADGYLALGDLKINEADFLMSFGIFLQLLDDLQDIDEDIKQNQKTIFTNANTQDQRDRYLIQLLNFILESIAFGQTIFKTKTDFFKVIRNCCLFLSVRSVYKNCDFFSDRIIDLLGVQSGYTFNQYVKQKSKINTIDRDEAHQYINHLFRNSHSFSLETLNI